MELKWKTRWEGRYGTTLTSFSSMQVVGTRPAIYIKTTSKQFEFNKIMFMPHKDVLIDVYGLPD